MLSAPLLSRWHSHAGVLVLSGLREICWLFRAESNSLGIGRGKEAGVSEVGDDQMEEQDAYEEIAAGLSPEGQRMFGKDVTRLKRWKVEKAEKRRVEEVGRKIDDLHDKFIGALRRGDYKPTTIEEDIKAMVVEQKNWWTPAVEQQKETDMLDEPIGAEEASRDAYPVEVTHEALRSLEDLETKIITLRNRLGVVLKDRPSIAVPAVDPQDAPASENRSSLMQILNRVPSKVSDLDNMVQLIIEDIDL